MNQQNADNYRRECEERQVCKTTGFELYRIYPLVILTDLRVSLMQAFRYFKLSMLATSRGASRRGRTLQISSYAEACFSGCSAS